MFQSKLLGVFVLFLTCVGISCQSGDDPPGPFHDGDESEALRLRPTNYETYDYQDERGCDHETRIALAEMKSEVQNLQKLLVGLRQKLDPDFKIPPSREKACPPGFQYVRLARSCYKVVYEDHNWTSAGERCRALHPEAHLVAITKRDEYIGLKAYLKRDLAEHLHLNRCKIHSWGDRGKMLWTSGQRLNETSCTKPFVWKISSETKLPLSFSDWSRTEPNCFNNTEQCLHLRQSEEFRWNDLKCETMLCPLCQCNQF